jgi:hypothetical protein
MCSIYQSIEISFSNFISHENNLNWYKKKIKLKAEIWKFLLQFFFNKYNTTSHKQVSRG